MMGILNATPDSFSDGGVFDDPPAAMRYTESRLAKIASELLDDLDRTVFYPQGGGQAGDAGFGRDDRPGVFVGHDLLAEAGEGIGQGGVDPAQLGLAGGVQQDERRLLLLRRGLAQFGRDHIRGTDPSGLWPAGIWTKQRAVLGCSGHRGRQCAKHRNQIPVQG